MTPLEIQIKTTADLQGVQLTVDALQRVKEATQQAAAKGNDYVESHSKVTQEMKDQAQAALRNISANEKVAESAASVGKNINSAKQAFSGLKDIIGGALNGNLLQVGSGLGKISAAAAHAGPAMSALFTQIARGASAALVVVGPIIVAIGAMKQIAAENERAMQRMWDEAARGAQRTAKEIEGVEAASKSVGDELEQSADKSAVRWGLFLKVLSDTQQRTQAIAAANLQRDLANIDADEAKTLLNTNPDELRGVQSRFARQREDVRARAEEIRLNDEERAAQQARVLALQQLAEQEKALAAARARASFSKTLIGVSPAMSRQAALDAQLLEEEEKRRAPAIAEARAARRASDTTLATVPVRRETLAAERAARGFTRRGQDAQAARQRQLGEESDTAGILGEGLARRLAAAPISKMDPQIEKIITDILGASRVVQSGGDLGRLADALESFLEATKQYQSNTRIEIKELVRSIKNTEQQLSTSRTK